MEALVCRARGAGGTAGKSSRVGYEAMSQQDESNIAAGRRFIELEFAEGYILANRQRFDEKSTRESAGGSRI